MSANRSLLAVPLLLLGCGGTDAGAPASGGFAAACHEQGRLEPALCDCLDAQAAILPPGSYRFVLATIAERHDEARHLRSQLDETEATEADRFVARGIQSCFVELPRRETADDPRKSGLAAPPTEDDAIGNNSMTTRRAQNTPP